MKIESVFLLAISGFLFLPEPGFSDDLSANRQRLSDLSRKLKIEMAADRSRALVLARQYNWPIRMDAADGSVVELQGMDHASPVYYSTHNLKAAITLGTDRVWPGGVMGHALSGEAQTIGIWEGGAVRADHQEFGGRVSQQDAGMSISSHATQVAGTLAAAGVKPEAKGMAYRATLRAYDWNSDLAEMTAEAAQGLLFSNHSYGPNAGWQYNSFDDSRYVWFGDPAVSLNEDYKFGYYLERARQWDEALYLSPDYLVCVSAGNDRYEDGNYSGKEHWVFNGSQWVLSSEKHDRDGGLYGYDCINGFALAKNVLTVGAVKPILDRYTSPDDVFLNFASSWGPTDDGRIKPDVVADGVSVFSASSNGMNEYASYDGTSAATPGVTGSVALIREHYRALFGDIAVKSSTLKALVIHSALEAGPDPGPDYKHGWGLVNTAGCIALITRDFASGKKLHIKEFNLNSGSVLEVGIESDGNQPLKATICWSDPAGPALAPALDNDSPILKNDLDLRVTGPTGIIFNPWILNPGQPQNAASTGDNFRDNVEQVYLAQPQAGIYTIRIFYKGILENGSQKVSLIVSGNIDKTVAPPGQPVLVSPAAGAIVDTEQVALAWTNLANAVSYNVELAYDEAFTDLFRNEEDLGVTFLTVGGLFAETGYYWRVNATNAGGQGVWSKTGSFRTSRQALLRVRQKISTTEMDQYINDLAINTRGDLFVAVYNPEGSMFGTLHRSVDGGKSWKRVNDALTRLALDGQNRLFGFYDDKIYRLGADGTGKTYYQDPDRKYFTSLCVDDRDYLYAGRSGGKIIRSTDHGDTWSPYSQVPVSSDGRTVQINFIYGHLFAATYGDGVYCSKDSGATWEKLTGGDAFNYAYTIEGSKDGHLLVGTISGIYRTPADRIDWVQLKNGILEKSKPTTILVQDCGVVYASSYGCAGLGDGIFISLDNGATWTTANAGLEQLSTTVIRSGPGDELYLGNGTGVYTEGGSVYKGSQELAVESAVRQLGLTPPAAVELASPAADARISAADIQLEWNGVPDACNYQAQVSIYADFSFLAFTGQSIVAELNIAQLAEFTTFYWRVRAVTSSGYSAWPAARMFTTTRLTQVETTGDAVPLFFSLEQNFPNPFNPSTTISFGVKESCQVLLELYDVLGRKVATLTDDRYESGFYQIDLKAAAMVSGVYFYRIKMADFSEVKKMILLQ